jgi:predicted RNase H-like HicB family nuclease
MMDKYVAVFRKTSSSDFGVEFLDLPGCFSAGSTLEEAKAMAAEALRLHLDGLQEDGVEPPEPSDLDAVERKLRGKRGNDFYALVEIEAQPEESKVVRVNITIEERLLREIDSAASEGGMSRSGFLADAARRSIRRSVRPSESKSRARRP